MVTALHPRTIEVTTEEHLTERGDCIIGVGADKGCAGLAEELKSALRVKGTKVTLGILVGDERFEVNALGDPRLSLSHSRDIVLRTSNFVNERTVAVCADRAADDIPRRMVERLKRDETGGILEIEVYPV